MSDRIEQSNSEIAWRSLSSLVGHWKGLMDGEAVEELWLPPAGGSMLGTFRWVDKNSQIRFYELMTISLEGEGVVLRIKHFDASLRGWEAQDASLEFDLVQRDDDTFVFRMRAEKEFNVIYSRVNVEDKAQLAVSFEPVESSPIGDSGFCFELV